MSTSSIWKSAERRIARFFGSERTPLSGGNSKHTRSDSLHPRLFVEAKRRKKHTVITLWDDTKTKAAKENKTPVVCLQEHNRPGFWIMVHSDDLTDVAHERLLVECRLKGKEHDETEELGSV